MSETRSEYFHCSTCGGTHVDCPDLKCTTSECGCGSKGEIPSPSPNDKPLLSCKCDYGVDSDEPTELDNDLEERLVSARNMIDLALLAFGEDKHELVPTAIEDAYYKLQWLVDDFCMVKPDE